MILTANAILDQVKTNAALTSGQAGLSNETILQLASDAMNLELVPSVIDRFEGHFLFEDTTPIVADTSLYRVPSRAIGSCLHAVFLRDASGNNIDLKKIEIQDYVSVPRAPQSRPFGYILVSNSVQLVPPVSPTPTDTLVMVYYFAPNRLVMQSAGRPVVSVSGDTITLPSVPTSWTTLPRPALDIVNHKPGNEIVAYDLAPTAISGNTITFATDVQALGVTAGNWVTVAGESVVPMIPEILHPLLAEMTVERVAEIRADETRLKQCRDRIKRLREGLDSILDRRVLAKPTVITGRAPFLR